jgi:hypothetical protein
MTQIFKYLIEHFSSSSLGRSKRESERGSLFKLIMGPRPFFPACQGRKYGKRIAPSMVGRSDEDEVVCPQIHTIACRSWIPSFFFIFFF